MRVTVSFQGQFYQLELLNKAGNCYKIRNYVFFVYSSFITEVRATTACELRKSSGEVGPEI